MSLSTSPFDGFDAPCAVSPFIERGHALRVIEQRVLAVQEPGNLSIIGLPRVGKTSLVYHALFKRDSLPDTRQILPIWLNLAGYEQPELFFRALAQQCIEQASNLGWSTSATQRAAQAALQEGISWSEGYARLQRYLQKLHQARPGIRIVCVLDDFDAAAELFIADPTYFSSIRGLYENPSWRVTFITISQLPLREIELLARGIPTLHVPFQEYYLTLFDDTEMQECYAHLAATGLTINDALTGRIEWYAGKHPYLLARLGSQLIAMGRANQQASVDDAFKHVEADFRAYYTLLMDTPGPANTCRDALADAIYRVPTEQPSDIEMLMKYGLIQRTPEGYEVFSRHFAVYLRETMPVADVQQADEEGEEFDEEWAGDAWQIELEQDEKHQDASPLAEDTSGAHLWSMWRETERTVRVALAATLQAKYGEDWFERLKQLHPALKMKGTTTLFDRCRITLEREIKNWGAREYGSMLEYSSPQDLFALLLAEWETLQPIFGEDPLYWKRCSRQLVEVRVLLAHNRDRSLHDFERRRASAYYAKILALLHPWRAVEHEQENQPVDLWSLWLETESTLRAVVALALEKRYGEQWFERIEAAYGQDAVDQRIKEYCQRWRVFREREISHFGVRRFQGYLDFAYPQEMFAIIFSVEWNTFQPIFRADQAYLLQLAYFFAKMRNPLAHHRAEAIRGENRQTAEDCCRELLAMLRNALDIAQEGESHA
ncbi:MAG TPA: hypothetical protein VFQ36_23145 [Ktedonobacteraceae bacterium]|nr:hypothetical protein [Ktedonobacteraceae bacterium]